MHQAIIESPLGNICLTADAESVQSIQFTAETTKIVATHPLLIETERQLNAYFEGRLQQFDLPLNQPGTPFQQSVWDCLMTIPFGITTSYLSIAEQLGNKNAVRAVGAANGKNQIAIVVPCHRIIGKNNELIGYNGELWRKEKLLQLEGSLPAKQGSLFT